MALKKENPTGKATSPTSKSTSKSNDKDSNDDDDDNKGSGSGSGDDDESDSGSEFESDDDSDDDDDDEDAYQKELNNPERRLDYEKISILGAPITDNKSIGLCRSFKVTQTANVPAGPDGFANSSLSYNFKSSSTGEKGAEIHMTYSGPSSKGASLDSLTLTGTMNLASPIKYGLIYIGGKAPNPKLFGDYFKSVSSESAFESAIEDYSLEAKVLAKPFSLTSKEDKEIDLTGDYRLIFFKATGKTLVLNPTQKEHFSWYSRQFLASLRNVKFISIKFYRPYMSIIGEKNDVDIGPVFFFGRHELESSSATATSSSNSSSPTKELSVNPRSPVLLDLERPRPLGTPALTLNRSLSFDGTLGTAPAKSVDMVYDAWKGGVTLTHMFSDAINIAVLAWVVKESDTSFNASALPGGPMPADCFLDTYKAGKLKFSRPPDFESLPLDNGLLIPIPKGIVARRVHFRLIVPREGHKYTEDEFDYHYIRKFWFFGVGRPISSEVVPELILYELNPYMEDSDFEWIASAYTEFETDSTVEEKYVLL